ncbi:hypothetical protein BLX88_26235 [Bacillus obstructivus]|jgi:hypothetical protein|nr:hypothetical protein BLX88_26235 [Bacillus obstructivus]
MEFIYYISTAIKAKQLHFENKYECHFPWSSRVNKGRGTNFGTKDWEAASLIRDGTKEHQQEHTEYFYDSH